MLGFDPIGLPGLEGVGPLGLEPPTGLLGFEGVGLPGLEGVGLLGFDPIGLLGFEPPGGVEGPGFEPPPVLGAFADVVFLGTGFSEVVFGGQEPSAGTGMVGFGIIGGKGVREPENAPPGFLGAVGFGLGSESDETGGAGLRIAESGTTFCMLLWCETSKQRRQ